MSKAAHLSLITVLACLLFAMGHPNPNDELTTAANIGAGVFSMLFLLAIIRGKKIKFDPTLH